MRVVAVKVHGRLPVVQGLLLHAHGLERIADAIIDDRSGGDCVGLLHPREDPLDEVGVLVARGNAHHASADVAGNARRRSQLQESQKCILGLLGLVLLGCDEEQARGCPVVVRYELEPLRIGNQAVPAPAGSVAEELGRVRSDGDLHWLRKPSGHGRIEHFQPSGLVGAARTLAEPEAERRVDFQFLDRALYVGDPRLLRLVPAQSGNGPSQIIGAADFLRRRAEHGDKPINIGPELLLVGGRLQQPMGGRQRVPVGTLGGQHVAAKDTAGLDAVFHPLVIDLRGQHIGHVVGPLGALLDCVQQQPLRLGQLRRLIAVQVHDSPSCVLGHRVQRQHLLVLRQSLHLILGVLVGSGDKGLAVEAVLAIWIGLQVMTDGCLDLGRLRPGLIQ